jgi:hypothetical protein
MPTSYPLSVNRQAFKPIELFKLNPETLKRSDAHESNCHHCSRAPYLRADYDIWQ